MTVKKKQLVGFNASPELAAALKQRVESLGLTMSDYLKGLVRDDLESKELPTTAVPVAPLTAAPSAGVPKKPKFTAESPPVPVILPDKFLALDLLTLTAWYVGFLDVIQYVHPADASLVARHYTPTDDTTRTAVLRQALREVVLEIARQVPRWTKQAATYLNG